MALGKTEIDAVVEEFIPFLVSGWIQKVHQPTSSSLSLEVRAPGQTLTMFLSVVPEHARIHLLTQRLTNPPSPPPFCQYLRAHIQGARIEQIEPDPTDRIVRFTLRAREGIRILVAALTGKGADCLLVDSHNRVLASMRHGRDLTGHPYHPPPPPHVSHPSRNSMFEVPKEGSGPFPISRAIEEQYRAIEIEAARTHARQQRLRHLRKDMKKTRQRISRFQADLHNLSRFRGYDRYGELLKAELGRMKKGQDSISLVDYFDHNLPELTIPLDPSKTPQANMEYYFKQHRKYEHAERVVRPRLQQSEEELSRLNKEFQSVQCDAWVPDSLHPGDLGHVSSLKTLSPKRSSTTKHAARSGPYKKFISTDDYLIYVGRNANENEELTHSFAHSDDLWLHARGSPGAHVVVRLPKSIDPPVETLQDAATLALWYSDCKKSGRGEVIYTKKKWVKKAKGRPAGTVLVTQEKSIFVKLDPGRLERLKSRKLHTLHD